MVRPSRRLNAALHIKPATNTPIPASGPAKIFETLRSPNYGSYVFGNGISLIGTWMQRIAVGWLVWQLTESAFWLGMVAFADLFPAVILGPFGGAVADRQDRLRLVQISQSLSCLQAGILFVLTVTDTITIHAIVLLSLFLGIVSAFNQPARLALVPSLVGPENLNAAIGINSVIFNLARFIGPAIAGGVIAAGHVSWVFGLNVLSFCVFVFILLRLRLTEPAKPRRQRKRFLTDLGEGVSYAFSNRRIAVNLLLLIAIGLGARPLVELLPGFAAAVFKGGPETLAILTSTFGAGAICGGLWLAGRNPQTDLSAIVIVAAFVISGGLTAFVATPSLWVALPATAVLGLALVLTGAGMQTLLQLEMDGDMRGRVLSLYGLIIRGGPAIGALAMGWAAESYGLRLSLAGGAAVVAVAALAIVMHKKRTPDF